MDIYPANKWHRSENFLKSMDIKAVNRIGFKKIIPGSHFWEAEVVPENIFIGIAGRGFNALDYTGRDGTRERDLMLRSMEAKYLQKNLPGKKVVVLNQIHGDKIFEVTAEGFREMQGKGEAVYGAGDGLFTRDADFALGIISADCFPIFFIDQKKGALGAVHAGWKGTRDKIAAKLITSMENRYGSSPTDILIYILPGISQNSYEVKEDVACYFPDHVTQRNGAIYLDLVSANLDLLLTKGVPKENIFLTSHCTFLDRELLYSHRAGDKSRNLNLIYVKGF
jgi:hypothetical protein